MDKETILIIDDDVGLRKTLADIFTAKGYEILTAGNGAEGLALLREHAVNVAFVDLVLPDISGIEVLYKVKTARPAIEVIILTGNATLDSAIEATNRGAFSYLLKPYDIDLLLAQVQRALAKQRAGEQVARRSAELVRSNAELKALYEISLASSLTSDLNELICQALRTLARMDLFPFVLQGAIFLVGEEGPRMASPGIIPSGNNRSGQHLCGLATIPGEVVASRVSSEECPLTTCNPGLPPHGHVIVPLKADGKTVGLLCLYTPPDCAVSDEMLRLLDTIGVQIGVGIGNARLYEETRTSSLHDQLTGLANRRFMELQLEKIFEITKRYGNHLSVVMMDVDNFKQFNDSRGHPAGDRLLSRLAAILVRETRHADYLFRYGGEEFLAILPNTTLEMAAKAADRLRSAVEGEAGVTISIGVAAYEKGLSDRNMLIRKADDALYRAKRNGRNRVEVASS